MLRQLYNGNFAVKIKALFLGLVVLSPISGMAATKTPSDTVNEAAERIMGQVEKRRSEFESNPVALHSYALEEIEKLIDKDRAARLTLGVYARSATPQEITTFGNALSRNLAARYGQAVLDFDGKIPIRILSENPLPQNRGVKISTLSKRKDGKDVSVDYFAREVGGSWRVFDVQIEGFSYSMTLKNMFAEDLRAKSITQVSADLDKNTDKMLANAKKK